LLIEPNNRPLISNDQRSSDQRWMLNHQGKQVLIIELAIAQVQRLILPAPSRQEIAWFQANALDQRL
jgi:hypothetical protein